ncbi:MAG: hypothetical protein P4L16_02720 [Chlamydiales bacterium]|nr:hypothetical protein [Chlamydiales bacterium]
MTAAATAVTTEPTFGSRVAGAWEQRRTLDKGLKFTINFSKLAEFVSQQWRKEWLFSEEVRGQAGTFNACAQTCTGFRKALKLGDMVDNFRSPKGKGVEKALDITQKPFFIISDATDIVTYIAQASDYSFPTVSVDLPGYGKTDVDVNEALGYVGGVTAACGLTTGVVASSYKLHQLKGMLADAEQRLVLANEAINQHAQSSFDANWTASSPAERAAFKVATRDIALAKEARTNHIMAVVEKVLDVAAIVFGFLGCFVAPVIFVPVMASLALISSGIALARIWLATNAVPQPTNQEILEIVA